ncbi:hypothetical protein ACFW2V_13405 [Streptomyces sp. NPDC058947]|uniref:hypothetical protein n=1 Tax=Streptomyces sp. NPDC058947 TaxID=3346675 RepID=UPI00367DC7F2
MATTYASMLDLWGACPVTALELIEVARNPDHTPWGNAGEELIRRHLLEEDGTMRDAVRRIVLSSSTGEGMNTTLTHPVKS